MKPKKICLLGFMGSGKSTIGKLLAKKMKLRFVDLDRFIEEKNKQTIPQIFENHSEAHFRKLESEALKELLFNSEALLISCGGGTLVSPENLQLVKEHAVSVYLKASEKTLFHRLNNAKANRPLIEGMSDEELFDYIVKALEEREKQYLQADIQVLARNAKSEIQAIAEKLDAYSK